MNTGFFWPGHPARSQSPPPPIMGSAGERMLPLCLSDEPFIFSALLRANLARRPRHLCGMPRTPKTERREPPCSRLYSGT